MNKSFKKLLWLVVLVVLCCIAMAVIETVIEPAYVVKSALKITLFLFVPLVFFKLKKEKILDRSYTLNVKKIFNLLGLGLVIYVVIMAVYFLTKGVFDYTALVNNLSEDQNVSQKSFVPVALYISFGNSLLEEFLFRFVAFIKLSEYTSKKLAYIFSSVAFALYHVGMFGNSFPIPLMLLSLLGLTIGGLIFNYVDDKNKNIYNSWIIHMFADFAIITIWYVNI